MNPVVHFEIPAEDTKRMSDFYTNVFGWHTQSMGKEMGNYVVVSTTEANKNGRPTVPGAINGGFYPKEANQPAQYPSVVIAVDDIKEHIKKFPQPGVKYLESLWKFRESDSMFHFLIQKETG